MLTLRVRAGDKAECLVELVHRAIPYPVVLVTSGEGTLGLSLAPKRWAQNQADRTVIDGEVVSIGRKAQCPPLRLAPRAPAQSFPPHALP